MIKVLTYLSVAVALSACSALANNPQVTIETTSDLPNCRGSNASTWTNCFGTRTRADGENFAVEFKDGEFNGQGTYNWADGENYVGDFLNDDFNGLGTFTYADGSKYVGEYKDDKRNGQGTFTDADGTIEKGIWKNGFFIG